MILYNVRNDINEAVQARMNGKNFAPIHEVSF
jgi:hypothetical protein